MGYTAMTSGVTLCGRKDWDTPPSQANGIDFARLAATRFWFCIVDELEVWAQTSPFEGIHQGMIKMFQPAKELGI